MRAKDLIYLKKIGNANEDHQHESFYINDISAMTLIGFYGLLWDLICVFSIIKP